MSIVLPIYYNLDATDALAIHDVKAVELEIQETMKKGYSLAKETIEREMNLLLTMSDYLSDHSFIEKENLKQMIQSHKISEVEFLENNDHVYYRRHLKKTISKSKHQESVTYERVCLNKNCKVE